MTTKMSFCLKAATSLEGADLDQLTASIEHYTRAGMPVGEAELAAVNDLLAQLYGERAEMTGLLREQHPDLFSTARAMKQAPAQPDAKVLAFLRGWSCVNAPQPPDAVDASSS